MGGSISGLVFNTDKVQAHSVKAFMVSSLFGKFKDVVCLIPVKSSTAEKLTHMLQKVLTMVQNARFIVVVDISDNNQVNAKTLQSICGSSSFEESIENRQHSGHKILFLYDTVHIIKCILNDCLNQSNFPI